MPVKIYENRPVDDQFPEQERYLFGLGAMTAPFAWFLILSLGAGLLAPLFRRPVAWQIRDSLVFLTMWSLALSLLWGELSWVS